MEGLRQINKHGSPPFVTSQFQLQLRYVVVLVQEGQSRKDKEAKIYADGTGLQGGKSAE